MLQIQTVSPELLEFLRFVSNSEVFKDFILVGGTGLALQIGHRNSIDLDFFSDCEIDKEKFVSVLEEFGEVQISSSTKNILILKINGIKVDFVNYKYPLIDDFVVIEGIKIASKKDIGAMKLNAIAGRGTKKDFIDLYFLLKEFSLSELIEFYQKKYTKHSQFQMIKSLIYFEDAEIYPQPKMFLEFNWEDCKETIKEKFDEISSYLE